MRARRARSRQGHRSAGSRVAAHRRAHVITRASDQVCGAEVWTTGSYAGGPGGGIDMTIAGRYGDVSALIAFRADRVDRSGLTLPDSSPAPRLRRGVLTDAPARLLLDS